MKKLQIIASLFIVCAIYFLLYILGKVFPNLEMFHFPYSASIWGSIADWIMIIVTALTAWFLWKTFQSQIMIQQMQQKQLDIEYYKHKKDIMPRFDFQVKKSIGKNTILNLDIFCRDAQAHIKEIICHKTESVDKKLTILENKSMHANSALGYSLQVNKEINFNVSISINYTDRDKNSYHQYLLIFDVEGKVNIHTSIPTLVDDI